MSQSPFELPAGPLGAVLTSGPSDWQIIQRDADGWGQLALAGRWVCPEPGVVEVCLVQQDTGVPVSRQLDWQPAATRPDGTWALTLNRVPAGGLYRLETRFNRTGNPKPEWSDRGDMRHCLGVGDLWVIAGQSNSAGRGLGPVYDPPELGVHLLRNTMQWALATHPLNDSTDTRHPVNREAANSGHAPHLHFARVLKQALGHPIGLIQTSRGGSYLEEWNPTDPEPSGGLYQNMLECIAAAGGRVTGVLWYQGEAEGGAGTGASYGERFERAVAAWRAGVGQPALPVLTVQLNRHYRPADAALARSWSLVREAQRQAAHRLPGVTVVPSFDLPLSDFIHTSPAGNMLLGDRLARAALGAVYGRPVDYRAPDLQTAVAAADGRRIDLTFAPVTSRMDNIDPNANCFQVEDSGGDVPITQVAYPGGPVVQLMLGRALAGRAVVHGGGGLAPATVPVDMEQLMPMLGFYGAAVAGVAAHKV
jgi:sialate O-acetylesterase